MKSKNKKKSNKYNIYIYLFIILSIVICFYYYKKSVIKNNKTFSFDNINKSNNNFYKNILNTKPIPASKLINTG